MGIVNVFILCASVTTTPGIVENFSLFSFLFSSFFHFSFFLFFVFHFFETSPMDVTHQYLPRGSFRSKSYPSPAHQQFVMLSQCLRLCVCAFVCLSVCLSLFVCLCLFLSSLVRDGHVRTLAPRVLLQPPLGLEEYAPPPGFEKSTHLCASHGIPVKAAPVRPRLFTAFSVTLPQPPVSGTHPVGSATTGKRSASTALAEPTILLVQILVQEVALFLKHEPLFFLWSILVNPNLKGMVTLIQLTVISCIINIDFLSFSGIQVRRAGILLILFQLPVVSFMRLFFRKPVIMFRTSLISSLSVLATQTSLSCSTRTPLSLTL